MKVKEKPKPYWEMTTNELAEATKEFDKEFIADSFRPMNAEDRKKWEHAKSKSRANKDGSKLRRISIHVDSRLLKSSETLAKRKGLSRDVLFARALKTVLIAEGEEIPT